MISYSGYCSVRRKGGGTADRMNINLQGLWLSSRRDCVLEILGFYQHFLQVKDFKWQGLQKTLLCQKASQSDNTELDGKTLSWAMPHVDKA